MNIYDISADVLGLIYHKLDAATSANFAVVSKQCQQISLANPKHLMYLYLNENVPFINPDGSFQQNKHKITDTLIVPEKLAVVLKEIQDNRFPKMIFKKGLFLVSKDISRQYATIVLLNGIIKHFGATTREGFYGVYMLVAFADRLSVLGTSSIWIMNSNLCRVLTSSRQHLNSDTCPCEIKAMLHY